MNKDTLKSCVIAGTVAALVVSIGVDQTVRVWHLVALVALVAAIATTDFLLARARERTLLQQLEAELEQCRKDLERTDALKLTSPEYVAARQALVQKMLRTEYDLAEARQRLYPRAKLSL